MKEADEKRDQPAKGLKSKLMIVALVVVAILPILSLEMMGAGERGMKLRFGAVQPVVLGEGLHFKIPFVEDIIQVDVKVHKPEMEAQVSSKDLQAVSSTIAVNHNIDPGAVDKLYQEIGITYKERVIDPTVQEGVKAVTARFTGEELITRRSEGKDCIKESVAERVKAFNISVDELEIAAVRIRQP